MSATPSKSVSAPVHGPVDLRDSFQPPWVLRNGHLQTLAGTYVFGRWPRHDVLPKITARQFEVPVDHGDQLVYHDECPAGWQTGERVVLLLHGLAGSHESPYMLRVARRFHRRMTRTIRLDWRGSGAGMALARYPYHSGRSEDLNSILVDLRRRFPNSELSVVGFSMGGNILLKLLGEVGAVEGGTAEIARAVSICPPVDLSFTVDHLRNGLARWYDHYFAKVCVRDVRRRKQMRPDAIVPDGWFAHIPRTMREFDETFTAPVCGYASAADYYSKSSAAQFLPTITVPTLIIAAQDDPVVPSIPLAKAQLSSAIELRITRHGGHVGFVTSTGPEWLDRQILAWTLGEE